MQLPRSSGILLHPTSLPGGRQTFAAEIEIWKSYFENPSRNGGLRARTIRDPQELHDLTAFFSLEVGNATGDTTPWSSTKVWSSGAS